MFSFYLITPLILHINIILPILNSASWQFLILWLLLWLWLWLWLISPWLLLLLIDGDWILHILTSSLQSSSMKLLSSSSNISSCLSSFSQVFNNCLSPLPVYIFPPWSLFSHSLLIWCSHLLLSQSSPPLFNTHISYFLSPCFHLLILSCSNFILIFNFLLDPFSPLLFLLFIHPHCFIILH